MILTFDITVYIVLKTAPLNEIFKLKNTCLLASFTHPSFPKTFAI